MQVSERDKRLLLLHEYRLGRKPNEAKNNICQSMGERAISKTNTNIWFNRFKNGDFEIDDLPRSGRPQIVNRDDVKHLIENNSKISTREIAEMLHCHHSTVSNVFKELGKIYKYGVPFPHSLSQNQLQLRIDTCTFLLSLKRNKERLKSIITGDEQWVFYVNYSGKKQWLESKEKGDPVVKSRLGEKKIMRSVWWGKKGIIY